MLRNRGYLKESGGKHRGSSSESEMTPLLEEAGKKKVGPVTFWPGAVVSVKPPGAMARIAAGIGAFIVTKIDTGKKTVYGKGIMGRTTYTLRLSDRGDSYIVRPSDGNGLEAMTGWVKVTKNTFQTEDVDIPLRERGYLAEEMPIGKTLETPLLRIHRYASSFHVTDLKNAGKRGARVDRFTLNDLDYNLDKATERLLGQFASQIHRAKSYKQARAMAQGVVDQNKKTGRGTVKIYDDWQKGVDVAPYGKKEVTIDNADMFIRSEINSFLIGDKRDRNNEPRTMEPTRGGKTAAKKFRAWVVKNRSAIEKMNYSEVLKAMRKVGIVGHSWCAMD